MSILQLRVWGLLELLVAEVKGHMSTGISEAEALNSVSSIIYVCFYTMALQQFPMKRFSVSCSTGSEANRLEIAKRNNIVIRSLNS